MDNDNKITSQSIPMYTIGDLARMYEIHPQILRFFDKKELIKPTRQGDGERRKYSFYELYRIALRKQHKIISSTILMSCSCAVYCMRN